MPLCGKIRGNKTMDKQISEVKLLDAIYGLMPSDAEVKVSTTQAAKNEILTHLITKVRNGELYEETSEASGTDISDNSGSVPSDTDSSGSGGDTV